ncbi:hypothetical protein [Labedaea rhizosphaerae]|uniref:EVE domain-containing protein n=1 Tax=Labedaea rhizosphaerae TaxID=598644 RepID=A0A4R6SBX2_LABRH|nr:hypothetical protein [Labedaea rhizosphaerae]TDP97084.1 hypothetical protein EV186_10342 [Labedaea rhizosphaerae]
MTTHWLYPVAAGGGCRDAAGVRETFRRTGTADWALASNFHQVGRGDLVWIYSGGAEQIVTALAKAVDDPHQDGSGTWFVRLEPDWAVTDYLAETPLPRSLFRQVPYTVSRATPVTEAYLTAHLLAARTFG